MMTKHTANAATPTTTWWNVVDLDLFLLRSDVLLFHVTADADADTAVAVMTDWWEVSE